jgi:hypothetical protein
MQPRLTGPPNPALIGNPKRGAAKIPESLNERS